MPWYTSTAAMPSSSRSAKSARRPSTDVGSERTRNVGELGDDEDERGVLHGSLPGEDHHERERDGQCGAQRRPELDQLAGGDGAADHRERQPTGCPGRRSRCRWRRRAPDDQDEQPSPASHDPAACSSGIRSPRPAEPVPASGGATAQSCSSTSWPAP